MGGVEADINGATKMKGVWAAGEVACHSMHGANRLGCNSTAECLVWGGITGEEIAKYVKSNPPLLDVPRSKSVWSTSISMKISSRRKVRKTCMILKESCGKRWTSM